MLDGPTGAFVVSGRAEKMLFRIQGDTGVPLLLRYGEARREVDGALNWKSRNLGPGTNTATRSSSDIGQVNFSSLSLSFPMSELRESDMNQRFKHSGNSRSQMGYPSEWIGLCVRY